MTTENFRLVKFKAGYAEPMSSGYWSAMINDTEFFWITSDQIRTLIFEAKFREALFFFDDYGTQVNDPLYTGIEGIHDPANHWNGFSTPYLTLDNVRLFAKGIAINEETDTRVIEFHENGKVTFRDKDGDYRETLHTIVVKGITYYDVSLGYCWYHSDKMKFKEWSQSEEYYYMVNKDVLELEASRFPDKPYNYIYIKAFSQLANKQQTLMSAVSQIKSKVRDWPEDTDNELLRDYLRRNGYKFIGLSADWSVDAWYLTDTLSLLVDDDQNILFQARVLTDTCNWYSAPIAATETEAIQILDQLTSLDYALDVVVEKTIRLCRANNEASTGQFDNWDKWEL